MKKLYIFVLCGAVLCTGLIYGTVFTATAEQEDIFHETQIEEPAEQEDLEELPVPESDPSSENASQPEASEQGDTSLFPEDHEDDSEQESDPLSENASESEASEPGDTSLVPVNPEDGFETESLSELENEEYQSNPYIAAAMQATYDSLDACITQTADLLEMPGDYACNLGEDNFFDALTVYAIRRGQTENFPYAIELAEEEDREELISIYWSLNPVSGANTEVGSLIQILRVSGRNISGLTREEMTQFSELYTAETREIMAELLHQ